MANTEKGIIEYIKMHQQARVVDLIRVLQVSKVVIHRHLKRLVERGEVRKVGSAPRVFYLLASKTPVIAYQEISEELKKTIDENYLYISPLGELLYGFEGFVRWVTEIKEEKRLVHLTDEYVRTLNEYKRHVNSKGWIDATAKIKNTFIEETFVDKLLYADFYTLPKFGKTKLGQLMLYAKQSQNRSLVLKVEEIVSPIIQSIISEYKINAVAFIPPTVPRQIQFMSEFKAVLNLSLPAIELVKSSSGEVVVPQKTLARLEERITNARETIFMRGTENSYPHILLIDDAVGSGATVNETARKLKNVMVGKKMIVAFAIVGSIKGFEVIREV